MWQMFGKTLMVAGVVLAAVGALLVFGGKIPFVGKLPGDLHIRRPNFTLYVPITTCILLSVLLTIILWLLSRFRGTP